MIRVSFKFRIEFRVSAMFRIRDGVKQRVRVGMVFRVRVQFYL